MSKFLYTYIFIMICSCATGQNNIIYLRYVTTTDDISVVSDTIEAVYDRSSTCVLCYSGNSYIGEDILGIIESKSFLFDKKDYIDNTEINSLNDVMSGFMVESVSAEGNSLHINGNFKGVFTLTFIMSYQDVFYDKLFRLIDVNELNDMKINMRFLIYDEEGVFRELDYAEMLKEHDGDVFMLNF